MNAYTLYRCHDLHFLVYGAMFLGRPRTSRSPPLTGWWQRSRSRCCGSMSPPMADCSRGSSPSALHVADPVRDVGRADRRAAPGRPRAVRRHHGIRPLRARRRVQRDRPGRRGRARSASCSGPPRRGSPRAAPCSTTPWSTSSRSPRRCSTASSRYRRGEHDAAFAALRRSIELDDHLPYDEPVGLDAAHPTRLRRAAARAGARRRGGRGLPRRPRSRRHAAPRPPPPAQRLEPARLPRVPGPAGRDAEAAEVKVELDAAQAQTDVPVVASCACRTVA